jgi:hypothetical protein
MQRAMIKLDESHSAMEMTMESSGEYQEYSKAVPDPCPGTHELRVSWVTNAKGMKVLRLEPVLKVTKPAPAATGAAQTIDTDPHAGVREKLRAELDAMKDERDLETYVVEKGAGPWPKKGSRAQKIAEVVERIIVLANGGVIDLRK